MKKHVLCAKINEIQTKLSQTVEFRGEEQFIHIEIDDISRMIDNQLVTIQTLLASPFVAPYGKCVVEKLAFLHYCHDPFDAWVEF